MPENQIADPDFGALRWDTRLHVWRGAVDSVEGQPVAILVHTASALTQRPPFDDATWDRTITPEARQTFARFRHMQRALQAAVIDEYLPKFASWNDGQRIDPPSFSRRISLRSVTLLPDGYAEASYDDGGMFGGHAIIVRLENDGRIGGTELFG